MPLLLHDALALFFIWLLAAAAWYKLRHPAYYRERLRSYLPALPVPVTLIAGLEIGLAAAFAVFPLRQAAFLFTALLLTVYLLAMLRQLLKGDADSRCGCAGPESDLRISPALIGRNGVLVLLALAGTLPVVDMAVGIGFYFNAVLIGLFLIVSYHCMEQLMLNAQRFRASRG